MTTALATTPHKLVKNRMLAMLKVITERDRPRFETAGLAVCLAPNIAACDPESVCSAIWACFRLNLVPDPVLRQAYIVPFKGKATVILGYNGVIDLARNAEPGLEVRTGVIYDNDDYVYRDGLEPVFEVSRYHWHKGESPGDLVFSYCIYRLPHQQKPTMVVVPRHKLDAIAASKHKSPWNDPDSFPAMCEKTAIKRAAKLWTLSPNKKETVAFREAINRIDEADPADLPAAPGGDEFAGFGDLPEGERAIGTVAPVNAPPMDSERKPVQSRLI